MKQVRRYLMAMGLVFFASYMWGQREPWEWEEPLER